MAHKALIGGAAYEISGGKTLVGGTAYSIDKGKTLVGGTGYDVSFGEAWNKYSCQVVANYSDQKEKDATATALSNNKTKSYSYWTSYSYNKTNGTFTLTGLVSQTLGNSVGYYCVSMKGKTGGVEGQTASYIYKVLSMTNTTPSFRLNGTMIYCDTTYTYYKGATPYGIVYVSDGEIPDGGSLVDGSIDGTYCVVKVGSEYYYYERV